MNDVHINYEPLQCVDILSYIKKYCGIVGYDTRDIQFIIFDIQDYLLNTCKLFSIDKKCTAITKNNIIKAIQILKNFYKTATKTAKFYFIFVSKKYKQIDYFTKKMNEHFNVINEEFSDVFPDKNVIPLKIITPNIKSVCLIIYRYLKKEGYGTILVSDISKCKNYVSEVTVKNIATRDYIHIHDADNTVSTYQIYTFEPNIVVDPVDNRLKLELKLY